MNNVDFLITTMDRYHLLEQLLNSIFEFYPKATVTIADQSKGFNEEFYKEWEKKGGQFITIRRLEFDCGLSYARNTLIKTTKLKYKLILEDDFLFTKNTRIETLLDLMDIADIAGGSVYQQGIRIPFEHYFEKRDDTIHQVPDGDVWMKHKYIKYKPTGCVLNFALFNRDVFDKVRWDDRLKIREHQHFFYRVKNKIVYTDDVKIEDNKKGNTPQYKALKGRDQFWKIALEDLGAKRFKYLSGKVVAIEKGKIVHYNEAKEIR